MEVFGEISKVHARTCNVRGAAGHVTGAQHTAPQTLSLFPQRHTQTHHTSPGQRPRGHNCYSTTTVGHKPGDVHSGKGDVPMKILPENCFT